MQFGSFVFPVSHQPERDSAVIDNTLEEILLAEKIGMHSVWLTEHHFDGAAAHADPLVFGAAIAARTERIRIGFAVAELAFHHPVRLAIQTSLLDNLSHGRLIVGTGRGSAYNHYEYLGFRYYHGRRTGAPGRDRRAAGGGVDGRRPALPGGTLGCKVPLASPTSLPAWPHPPLVRACISEASTMKMAQIGRPIMIGIQTLPTLQRRLDGYRGTMLEAGFAEQDVEAALDQCWASRDLFVAESYEEALDVASAGFERERTHFRHAREQFNPGGFPPPDPNRPAPPGEVLEQAFILGTPSQVADQVAEMRDIGVRNLMLKLNTGEMDTHQVRKSMQLLGDKVMPLFAQ